ncbi:hypothetical protein CSC76_12760 [Pseudoxanthomonas mexicana]|nr:hypothetical protein CSC76_12760 [Pseudoxanthomonas mexicana]
MRPSQPSGPSLKATPLQWKTDWCFEQSQQRRHYVIEPWLDGRRVGRAHGWFESGERFVLEKIEIDSRQRSRGYGSTVIERLRQKARDEGCRELVINNVRASNHRAISLYEALGAKAVPLSSSLCAFAISPP